MVEALSEERLRVKNWDLGNALGNWIGGYLSSWIYGYEDTIYDLWKRTFEFNLTSIQGKCLVGCQTDV